MRNILVTGGSGFIGASLVHRLVDRGFTVRVLDNHFRGVAASLAALDDRIEPVEGDVRDARTVAQCVAGMDTVFHLAAINGTKYFYEKPELVLEVNVKGVINTLEAAIAAGVSRYVFASSSEVYNEPERVPTPEDERIIIPDITNPRFSYAGSKIIGELFCLNYGPKYGIETIIVRYHNVYGPRMGYEHVIPELIGKIRKLSDDLRLKEICLPIQGTGDETRAFCYVEDAVDATLIAAEKGQPHHIYHVGNDQEEIQIRELARKIAALLDVEIAIVPGELRPGGTTRRCPSITKLMALGYQPKVRLEDGLRTTCAWYMGQTPWWQGNA